MVKYSADRACRGPWQQHRNIIEKQTGIGQSLAVFLRTEARRNPNEREVTGAWKNDIISEGLFVKPLMNFQVP